MAADYDEIDYEDAWYDSYDEWSENAVASASTRQENMAEFMNTIPGVDGVGADDVMDGGFTESVQEFSEDDWTDVPRDKREWAARYLANTQEDTTLQDARDSLGLN